MDIKYESLKLLLKPGGICLIRAWKAVGRLSCALATRIKLLISSTGADRNAVTCWMYSCITVYSVVSMVNPLAGDLLAT